MSHPDPVPSVAPRSSQQSPAVRRLHRQAPLQKHVVTYRHGGRTFVRLLAGTSHQVTLIDCITGEHLRVGPDGGVLSPALLEGMIAAKTVGRHVQADTTFLMLLMRSAFGPGFLDQVETVSVRLLVDRPRPRAWNGRQHRRTGVGAEGQRETFRNR